MPQNPYINDNVPNNQNVSIDKQAKFHIPQFYVQLNDTKTNDHRPFSYHKQESLIWTSWTQYAHQANTQKSI